ncbi:hypothetical protein, partial [Enterobacter hormaechei]
MDELEALYRQKREEGNEGLVVKDQVGGQAVLGRQCTVTTPWLTERHGYDKTRPSDYDGILQKAADSHGVSYDL